MGLIIPNISVDVDSFWDESASTVLLNQLRYSFEGRAFPRRICESKILISQFLQRFCLLCVCCRTFAEHMYYTWQAVSTVVTPRQNRYSRAISIFEKSIIHNYCIITHHSRRVTTAMDSDNGQADLSDKRRDGLKSSIRCEMTPLKISIQKICK